MCVCWSNCIQSSLKCVRFVSPLHVVRILCMYRAPYINISITVGFSSCDSSAFNDCNFHAFVCVSTHSIRHVTILCLDDLSLSRFLAWPKVSSIYLLPSCINSYAFDDLSDALDRPNNTTPNHPSTNYNNIYGRTEPLLGTTQSICMSTESYKFA